jgi:hypothetical protein
VRFPSADEVATLHRSRSGSRITSLTGYCLLRERAVGFENELNRLGQISAGLLERCTLGIGARQLLDEADVPEGHLLENGSQFRHELNLPGNVAAGNTVPTRISKIKRGVLAFVYPATRGLVKLATGARSDRVGRSPMIVAGILAHGAALVAMVLVHGFTAWLLAACSASARPWSIRRCSPRSCSASARPWSIRRCSPPIGDVARPSWRGSAVAVYRLWRDSGYAAGALLAGGLADAVPNANAVSIVAAAG